MTEAIVIPYSYQRVHLAYLALLALAEPVILHFLPSPYYLVLLPCTMVYYSCNAVGPSIISTWGPTLAQRGACPSTMPAGQMLAGLPSGCSTQVHGTIEVLQRLVEPRAPATAKATTTTTTSTTTTTTTTTAATTARSAAAVWTAFATTTTVATYSTTTPRAVQVLGLTGATTGPLQELFTT